MTADSPHILMSVSKSMLGLLAGVWFTAAFSSPSASVTDVIPEVAGTAYGGATIRDLLDMRAGIAFEEDYLATSAPSSRTARPPTGIPLEPGDAPSDLRSFYAS